MKREELDQRDQRIIISVVEDRCDRCSTRLLRASAHFLGLMLLCNDCNAMVLDSIVREGMKVGREVAG